jgi:hypothetical protein
MATTMGGVSSAMVGLTFSRSGGSSEGRVISARTVDMVSAVYVPLAIMMVCYAFFMYISRSTFMRKKQVRCARAGARGGGSGRGAQEARVPLPRVGGRACQAPQMAVAAGSGADSSCLQREGSPSICVIRPTPPIPQVGFFDDKVGPITLASITLVTLVAITIMAFIDVFA